MASKVEIIGGAPSVNLGVCNFSDDIAPLGLLSWCSFDSSVTTVVAKQITEVLPRAGMYGLVKTADSAGPQPVTRIGYGGGKMVDDTLCYLYSPAPIDDADFSVAMIWHLDDYKGTAQDLLACYRTPKSLRLWQLNGYVSCRSGAKDIVRGVTRWNASGPLLSILSASSGMARIRTRSSSFTETIQTGARTPSAGSDCRAVFGADKMTDGTAGGAPSASRAMRDTILDTLVFGRDILSDPGDPALSLIDQYFREVYADGQ